VAGVAYAQPVGTDPIMAQLLSTMQQSQFQMMQMLVEMQKERKADAEKTAQAFEAVQMNQARSAKQNNTVRSLKSPQYTDIPDGGEEVDDNREMLMKVPMEISVEVGRTRKPIKDILELTQGSLVVLDKMAGEQADLYVNGECIAHGDIVVVEDNFGIRITEILNKDIYKEQI
jgi:flagellar motor switch protein FliN/FliY